MIPRRRGVLCLALLSMVLSASLGAAEARINRYVKYDAGEFVIITSRSSGQARDFASDLARFRVMLEKTLRRNSVRNEFPTTIVITSSADWHKYLQPRENIAGFFQRGNFSNYMALDGDGSAEAATSLIFHEYTHYYLATRFAGEYPPWFNEGLAELMGYAKFERGRAITRVPMWQVHEARDSDWIPFERLIKVDHLSREYQSHSLMPSFYAQAWLTVHYGLVENREFGAQIIQYLNDLNRLVPQEQAALAAFKDLGAVDATLREYSRNRRFASGVVNLEEVPAVTLSPGQPLAEADAAALLADVMIESHIAPPRVRQMVELVEKREPTAARTAVLQARLAHLEDDSAAFDAAVGRAEKTIAADDWLSRRELANVLLTSAQDFNPMSTRKSGDRERDLQRALKWFGDAIAHNHEDVEALWGFGTAASQLDRHLDLAEQALVAAYHRAPGSAEISASLASLKSRQQEPEAMIPYLKDTIRHATDLRTRQWATDTLKQMEEFLAERARVEAENQKRREEYERQVAEYERKYGKPKKKK